jgi:predicted RNase H-like HicB family nuclease
MSRIKALLVVAISLSLCGAEGAGAQGKTREQVKAELAEAIRTGDVTFGEADRKLNEIAPQRYPAKPAVVGKTRQQVRAELQDAVRTGDIDVGEIGLKLNEIAPQRYPKDPEAAQAVH